MEAESISLILTPICSSGNTVNQWFDHNHRHHHLRHCGPRIPFCFFSKPTFFSPRSSFLSLGWVALKNPTGPVSSMTLHLRLTLSSPNPTLHPQFQNPSLNPPNLTRPSSSRSPTITGLDPSRTSPFSSSFCSSFSALSALASSQLWIGTPILPAFLLILMTPVPLLVSRTPLPRWSNNPFRITWNFRRVRISWRIWYGPL